jgi:hypothetical protein
LKRNYIWGYANKKVEYHWTGLDNRHTAGGEDVSLTRRPLVTPRKTFWYSFLLEAE